MVEQRYGEEWTNKFFMLSEIKIFDDVIFKYTNVIVWC